ncbi:hypothetical protein H072_6303 [Dactylellina haptotyla CBS 200.50]|uniref:Uncharacterized protein n=1 Tax=Dactylellina haptotyla (strain CBS 200.50) TaxID=1284197 RepID=S8AAK3_DACHA|nr:hypothetical protein H072_6303 [Dactylellina haptotyla CBS 200.50]
MKVSKILSITAFCASVRCSPLKPGYFPDESSVSDFELDAAVDDGDLVEEDALATTHVGGYPSNTDPYPDAFGDPFGFEDIPLATSYTDLQNAAGLAQFDDITDLTTGLILDDQRDTYPDDMGGNFKLADIPMATSYTGVYGYPKGDTSDQFDDVNIGRIYDPDQGPTYPDAMKKKLAWGDIPVATSITNLDDMPIEDTNSQYDDLTVGRMMGSGQSPTYPSALESKFTLGNIPMARSYTNLDGSF